MKQIEDEFLDSNLYELYNQVHDYNLTWYKTDDGQYVAEYLDLIKSQPSDNPTAALFSLIDELGSLHYEQ